MQVDSKSDKTEDKHEVHLGSSLQSMHYEMLQAGDRFTGKEERFREFFEIVIRMRRPENADPTEFREKMLRDLETFVRIYKQRQGMITILSS